MRLVAFGDKWYPERIFEDIVARRLNEVYPSSLANHPWITGKRDYAEHTILSFTSHFLYRTKPVSPGQKWVRKGIHRGKNGTDSTEQVIAGVLVLATLPLIPILIPSLAPSSVQAGLQSIQSQSLLFGTTWALYLVSDLLYLIPFPAFYLVLKQTNRAATLIATVFTIVFVTIDVGVDIPFRLSLIGLSNSYTTANSAQQPAYLATGQLTMDMANIVALVATLMQFSAVMLVSYAMLKNGEIFRKSAAYGGAASGVLGLLFIPAFSLGVQQLSGLFNLGGFVLLVIWSLVSGYKLYKLR